MTQRSDKNILPVEPIDGPRLLSTARQEVSILDTLLILMRRKWFIAKVALIVAAVGLVVSLILPVRYTAESMLVPPQQNQSLQSMLLTQLGGLSSLGNITGMTGGSSLLKNPADMYVSMLQSRTVEDAVIDRNQLMKVYSKKKLSDTRKKLESRSTITAGTKDGLIHIEVEDHDPKRAADIANSYVEEFRRLTSGLALTEAGQRRQFFQEQLVTAKDDLANAEEALKKTEQQTGLIQVDSQARALVESAAALRAQIAAKQVQLQTMSSFATAENPQVQILRHQLDALQAQLKQAGGSTEGGSDVDLVALRGKIPEVGLDYLRKLRDVRYYETIFELLSKQFEIAKLDEARQGIVQVVDKAVPPDKKSFPKRALITVLAFFVGLFAAIAWVLSSESVARAHPDEQAKVREFRTLLWNPRSKD